MQSDCSISNNFSLYLFLIISLILVSVDILGIYHIVLTWKASINASTVVFETCLKWQLISKTCFAVFSSLAAISSLVLCGFLIINMEFFTDKMLNTFLYYNYLIFGPYMLGFCILGLIFWNETSYVCSKHNINYKFFSTSNAFSLVFSLVVSIIITIGVAVYKAINLFIDSMLQKPDGYDFIRKWVLWIALRSSNASELIRGMGNQQNNNENRQQEGELARIRIGH